jgi:hypothetical protein
MVPSPPERLPVGSTKNVVRSWREALLSDSKTKCYSEGSRQKEELIEFFWTRLQHRIIQYTSSVRSHVIPNGRERTLLAWLQALFVERRQRLPWACSIDCFSSITGSWLLPIFNGITVRIPTYVSAKFWLEYSLKSILPRFLFVMCMMWWMRNPA